MPSLVERIAALEAHDRDQDRRLDGHHKTLFGAEGNGGQVADVKAVTVSHANLAKATEGFTERVETILVGEDGDAGLVGDVSAMKRRQALVAKLAWLLGGVAATELGYIVAQGIRAVLRQP